MNVKQLMDALSGLPDDMEVIIQKDAEGNGYSPLYGADPDAVYIKYGDVYCTEWSAYGACMSEEEWAEILAMPRALILQPEN